MAAEDKMYYTDGRLKCWAKNGQLTFDCAYNYYTGRVNNLATQWHRNGEFKFKSYYIEGLKEGEEIEYDVWN